MRNVSAWGVIGVSGSPSAAKTTIIAASTLAKIAAADSVRTLMMNAVLMNTGTPRSKAVHVNDRLGESLRSFLR